MTEVPDLPELPDLEQYAAAARARIAQFERVRDDATHEIEKARQLLDRLESLNAPAAKRRKPENDVGESAYRRVLEALGNHAYAGIATVATESTYAQSHVARTLVLAVERGHASREVMRRGRYRYRLTELGLEFVTAELCLKDDGLCGAPLGDRGVCDQPAGHDGPHVF
jgi:hypothetical protein